MGLSTQVVYCVRSLDGVSQASHHDLMSLYRRCVSESFGPIYLAARRISFIICQPSGCDFGSLDTISHSSHFENITFLHRIIL